LFLKVVLNRHVIKQKISGNLGEKKWQC